MTIPLSAFAGNGLDVGDLASIKLAFDVEDEGVVVIERITLAPAAPAHGPGATNDSGP